MLLRLYMLLTATLMAAFSATCLALFIFGPENPEHPANVILLAMAVAFGAAAWLAYLR